MNFGFKQRGFISNCQAHCTDPSSGLLEMKTIQTMRERPEREAAGDTTIWNADRTANGTTQYRGALLEEKHEVKVSLRLRLACSSLLKSSSPFATSRPAKSEIYRHLCAYVHIHRGICQSALGPQPTQARFQAPGPAEAVQKLPARDAPVVRHGRHPLRASPWGSNNYGNLKRGRLPPAHPSNARGTLMVRTLALYMWSPQANRWPRRSGG